MNAEQLEDLKQVIITTVSQSEVRLREDLSQSEARLRQELSQNELRLHKETEAGFAGVGDAIESLANYLDKRLGEGGLQLDDHEHRLTRLEKRAS